MTTDLEFFQRGHVYRAKVPRNVGGLVNDRVITWVSPIGGELQYDGPAVANGRHYPRCTVAAFRKWAGEDVTERMPPGEWQTWPPPPPQPSSAPLIIQPERAMFIRPVAT